MENTPEAKAVRHAVATAALERATRERLAKEAAPLPWEVEPFAALDCDRRPFEKLIDSEMLQKELKSKVLKSLIIIQKVTNNILELPNPDPHPEEPSKFRRFRLANRNIQEMMEVKACFSFLVQAGFRIKVMDFEEWFVFPTSPSQKQLFTLETASIVVSKFVKRLNDQVAEEEMRKAAAKEDEDMRWRLAVLDIEGDTERRKELKKKRELKFANLPKVTDDIDRRDL
ncbi:hypothetical protein T439DRAFT_356732 [Meredithblackwellia eburnea MCA 4105]